MSLSSASKVSMRSRYAILVTLALLQIIPNVRTNVEEDGLLMALRRLVRETTQGEASLPINIISSSRQEMTRYLHLNLQCNNADSACEGVPTALFSDTQSDSLWYWMRKRRMQWRGFLNLLLVSNGSDAEFFTNYFAMVKDRFFTGEGLGIADSRRQDLIFRNIFHWFHIEGSEFERIKSLVKQDLEESMNVLLSKFNAINNNTEIWWSKASPDGTGEFSLVNSWDHESQSFANDDWLFPRIDLVYSDMKGRTFQHPTMHKPPWNFVTYNATTGDYLEDNGGRDITLTQILADQLNFTLASVDPADFDIKRSRGSLWGDNFTFPHILGKVHRREEPFHFYLGDTTQTYTRNSAVEFSFYVLADSGAFVTRAPKRIVPPDIILRPFTYVVWTWLICVSVVVFFFSVCFAEYGARMNRAHRPPQAKVTNVFKKDNFGKRARKTLDSLIRIALVEDERFFFHKSSFFDTPLMMVLLCWMVTVNLVLLSSYQGNLLSFFFLPVTQAPVDTLEQLRQRMDKGNMSLGVTDGSSSFGIISTGGGIYGQLWEIMQAKADWLIASVEAGLLKTASDENFAVFAGREKLVYDTIKYGPDRFHINSEVFFPKYKAIVLRNGSPLRSNFDRVLLSLYDTGIINKITLDEYNGITKRQGMYGYVFEEERISARQETAADDDNGGDVGTLTLFQLSGMFYIYLVLIAVATLCFLLEVSLGHWRRATKKTDVIPANMRYPADDRLKDKNWSRWYGIYQNVKEPMDLWT